MCQDVPRFWWGIAKSWRLDTIRAKAGDDDDVDAKRRENAAWRQWHRARLRGETDADIAEESEQQLGEGFLDGWCDSQPMELAVSGWCLDHPFWILT